MLKILKNLKKSWLSVVFIVVLLCLQAWTDLTLPDYTSKIVNTGIQAGGIEYVAPEVIRKSQMDNLLIFTDKDEEILSNYTLISKNNLSQEEYNKLQKDYPELENQDLYKLNKLNKEQKEELDELITKPFMTLYFIQNEEMANGMKEQMLLNMPNEQKENYIAEINKQIDEKLGTMVDQAAVQATKKEYTEIGVNTDNIQNRYIILTGLQMIGIALISMIAAVIIMLLSSRVAATLGRILRDKVFKKVLQFTRKEFNEFSTANQEKRLAFYLKELK